MLLGIDPALNAELLYVLRAMGHGDELVVCDANFPADSTAKQTVHGKPLRMENLLAAQAVRAILSVLPLDTFVETPAYRMEVVGEPETWPAVQREVQGEINAAAKRVVQRDEWPMGALERFAFYERAKHAYAVVVTGERRFYGCFLLTKGVIGPQAP